MAKKTKQIVIRLTNDQYDAFKKHAESVDETVSHLARIQLKKYLQ